MANQSYASETKRKNLKESDRVEVRQLKTRTKLAGFVNRCHSEVFDCQIASQRRVRPLCKIAGSSTLPNTVHPMTLITLSRTHLQKPSILVKIK